MQEVLRFNELSSREQLSHIEMDPPAEIAESSFFHDGIQFSVSARDFSPTQMDEVELPTSSSSASASTTMRPPSSFSGPPIDEWRYTIILLLAPAVPPARAATSSAPNAVPPRVAPVNHAPAVDAAQVAAPPLIFIPGLAPGPMPEPLFPLADPEPVFGANSRHRLRARIFTAGLTIACAGRSLLVPRLGSRPIYRPCSARPRFCCRDCFGGNASGAGSGVSRRKQVV